MDNMLEKCKMRLSSRGIGSIVVNLLYCSEKKLTFVPVLNASVHCFKLVSLFLCVLASDVHQVHKG